MPLKLNSSGGGSVTLDVPATATATNLVVPAANGTVVVADNSGNVTYSGATTFSGNATFNAGLVPSSSFLRNRLINGGFDVWQRGTSFASPAGGAYLADRYFTFFGSLTSFSRSTDAPTGFRYSAEIVGTDVSVYQKIEDLNCDNLAGGAVTFSFWARSVSGSGVLAVALLSPTAPNNYASFTTIYNAVVSVSPSASWTRYTVTANVDANIVNGLQVQIYRGGAATTLITGFQLEAGTAATAFERRQYGHELFLCQRYYAAQSAAQLSRAYNYSSITLDVWHFVCLPATMRVAPTVTAVLDVNDGPNVSPNFISSSTTSFGLTRYGLASIAFLDLNSWTASAEL